MSEINDRIKQIRKYLRLSQPEFGKRLGVSRDVIANIDRDAVEPKMLFLEHLCQVYKVNPDWLLHGEGEMFFDSPEDKDEDELADFFNAVLSNKKPEACKNTMLVFSRIKDDQWELVGSILDIYYELKIKSKKDDQ